MIFHFSRDDMEMMLNKIVPEVSVHSTYWTWYVENVTFYSMIDGVVSILLQTQQHSYHLLFLVQGYVIHMHEGWAFHLL